MNNNNPIIIIDADGNRRLIQIVGLIGSNGETVSVQNNAIDTNPINRITPPLITSLAKAKSNTTLTAIANIDDTSITVTDPTGIIIGDYIVIFNTATSRFYQGRALNAGVNPVLLDRPLDSVMQIGDQVAIATSNLNVDGSVTPQIFKLRGDTDPINITVGITRIIITMQLTSAGNLSQFGNLPALTKGIVLRRVDSFTSNIFNVKNNREIQALGYDLQFIDAVGVAPDGLAARISFSGKDKMDTVIKVGPNENIELIIQDNLTGLTDFEITMEGYVYE